MRKGELRHFPQLEKKNRETSEVNFNLWDMEIYESNLKRNRRVKKERTFSVGCIFIKRTKEIYNAIYVS